MTSEMEILDGPPQQRGTLRIFAIMIALSV